MDKLEKYRNIIIEYLKQYEELEKKELITTQLIIDKERDHYILLDLGWESNSRIYSTAFHFDIIDYKLWIQKDNTGLNPVEVFLEKGIPKEDIVLGFMPEHKRQFTDYAVK
jgi:hypothetical protein